MLLIEPLVDDGSKKYFFQLALSLDLLDPEQENKWLHEEFEHLRQEMITEGILKGLHHPDVLKISQNLDQLHNRIMMSRLSTK